MDIARPDLADAKRRKRYYIAAGVVLLLAFATYGVTRLKPAAPLVDGSGLWIDTVKRGSMLRQVRGTGTLVPEQVRWIAAATEGRVERILVKPGTVVQAETVLLELTNPEVEQTSTDAELQLRAAVAELQRRDVELQSSILAQQANAANVDTQLGDAKAIADADEELARNGLTSKLVADRSRARAADLTVRSDIEKKRLVIARRAADAELAAQRARVDQLRALYELRQGQRSALQVRAGINGVLQQLPVEVGQRITAGATLAKVAQPEPLKAELRVAETQARDIAIGQPVTIDTRNGTAQGRVTRVDPGVQNGTVAVDVQIVSALPKGARPDLTVDGVIELERLENVLYCSRPVQGSDGATIGIFKLTADGKEAVQTPVAIGRTSVSAVEIRSGLREGERVILSDMSAWDQHQRIRLD